jgi:hypothetical protein
VRDVIIMRQPLTVSGSSSSPAEDQATLSNCVISGRLEVTPNLATRILYAQYEIYLELIVVFLDRLGAGALGNVVGRKTMNRHRSAWWRFIV